MSGQASLAISRQLLSLAGGHDSARVWLARHPRDKFALYPSDDPHGVVHDWCAVATASAGTGAQLVRSACFYVPNARNLALPTDNALHPQLTSLSVYRQYAWEYLRREYNCLVRVKTSITFPAELLARLDRIDKNRSALLERAAFAYLAHLERVDRDRRDIEIIRLHAGRLNREAQDTAEYQTLHFNAGSGRKRPARSS